MRPGLERASEGWTIDTHMLPVCSQGNEKENTTQTEIDGWHANTKCVRTSVHRHTSRSTNCLLRIGMTVRNAWNVSLQIVCGNVECIFERECCVWKASLYGGRRWVVCTIAWIPHQPDFARADRITRYRETLRAITHTRSHTHLYSTHLFH